ncbi:MAG: hypothetical protein KBS85_07780 [Lachnospiraceae bacterium]|nr:hypothetical protein [Candidatus Merdinaster equi]
MGYIVLDIVWSFGLVGRKVQYSLNEIAAIKLDDEIHSTDSFRFIKESDDGYFKSELHFDVEGKITVGTDKEGWVEFGKWAGYEDVILIWDKDINKLIKYMNKEVGGTISPRRFIHMEDLYVAMTSSVRDVTPKYMTAMDEMGLSYEQSMARFPVYKTQSMVRLYRKLNIAGKKHLDTKYDQYVKSGDFTAICVTNFFPKLDRIESKNKTKEIRELMKKCGVEARVTGSVVKFETDYANFVFNYDSDKGKLTYTTKSFYKGLRCVNVNLGKEKDMLSILKTYVVKAKEIDKRLAHGVGSKEVIAILKKLCV